MPSSHLLLNLPRMKAFSVTKNFAESHMDSTLINPFSSKSDFAEAHSSYFKQSCSDILIDSAEAKLSALWKKR